MNEMVEKVARAICEVERMNPDDALGGWVHWVPAARAAIEAMREPTEAMLYRGEGMCDFVMPEGFDNTREARQQELRCGWLTMVSAALTHPVQSSQTPPAQAPEQQ